MTHHNGMTIALDHATQQAPRAVVRKSLLVALVATVIGTAGVFAIVRDGRWVMLLDPNVRVHADGQYFEAAPSAGQSHGSAQLAFDPS